MTSARSWHAVPVLDAGSERWAAERSKRRRELGRLDAVRLLVAAIVVIDTLGSMTKGGAQTLTWLATLTVLSSCPPGWSSPTPTPTARRLAGDRLGVLLAELLPLAAVVDAAEVATDMEVSVGVCESGHCPTAQPREE